MPDYNDAIQNLRLTVSDDELAAGQLAVRANGLPLLWSGNFADVYKVHCPATGNTWAMKCFTREVPGLRDRYREISQHLGQSQLPFIVDFQFIEPGILVDGRWHPFLKMRWVEGFNLNQFIGDHLNQPGLLRQLLDLWLKLSVRLWEKYIAHGDLQHGNVLLVPVPQTGALSLKLIDYDGMCVPSLLGSPSNEVGHPTYQHPRRRHQQTCSSEVDRFSHLAIYCALRCLLTNPEELWSQYDNGDNLLFSEADFARPADSQLFQRLWSCAEVEVRALVGHLILATRMPMEDVPLLSAIVRDRHVQPLSPEEEADVGRVMSGKVEAPPIVAPPVASAAFVAATQAPLSPPGNEQVSPAARHDAPPVLAGLFRKQPGNSNALALLPRVLAAMLLLGVAGMAYIFYARSVHSTGDSPLRGAQSGPAAAEPGLGLANNAAVSAAPGRPEGSASVALRPGESTQAAAKPADSTAPSTPPTASPNPDVAMTPVAGAVPAGRDGESAPSIAAADGQSVKTATDRTTGDKRATADSPPSPADESLAQLTDKLEAAVRAGEASLAIELINRMAPLCPDDLLRIEVETLQKLFAMEKPPENCRLLAEFGSRAIELAIEKNQPDMVARILEPVLSAARKSQDFYLIGRVTLGILKIRGIAKSQPQGSDTSKAKDDGDPKSEVDSDQPTTK